MYYLVDDIDDAIFDECVESPRLFNTSVTRKRTCQLT